MDGQMDVRYIAATTTVHEIMDTHAMTHNDIAVRNSRLANVQEQIDIQKESKEKTDLKSIAAPSPHHPLKPPPDKHITAIRASQGMQSTSRFE